MGTNQSNFNFNPSESPIRPTNCGNRTITYTQENIVFFENLPSTNFGILNIRTTGNGTPLKRALLPENQDETASNRIAAKSLWSAIVRPELESYVRKVLDAYAVNDALSFQQSINLSYVIITYLFVLTEPVPMVTKTVQSVTVQKVQKVWNRGG